MPQPPNKANNARGFTLVELVVVVLILGILAGVAAPRFLDVSSSGQEAVARATLLTIADQIEIQAARQGDIPDDILSEWFKGNQLPDNPYNDFGVPSIQLVRNPARDHPTGKVLAAASPGAIWYNTANGAVRMRVPGQRTDPETLALYNRVNGSSLSDLTGG